MEGQDPQPPSEAAAPPPAAAARFCARCGRALPEGGGACGRCADRQERIRSAEEQVARGGRPLASALGLYGAILLVHLVVWLVATAWLGVEGAGHVRAQWSMQAVDTVLVLGWCLARRADLSPTLRRGGGPGWLGFAVVLSVLTWGVATVLMEGVRALVHAEGAGLVRGVLESGHGWTAVVGSICVQPAVVEELAFRGVILGALLHVMRAREVVLVSAVMFAGLHLTPLAFPHLILLGAVAGWLRVRTGSVYPGMALHFGHNLWCCLAEHLNLFGESPG